MNTFRSVLVAALVTVAACGPSNPPNDSGSNPDNGSIPDNDSGGATCMQTNFTPSVGLESCFDCMMQNCCAEVQACDTDPDCVYCTSAAGQIDSSERCVDPRTFMVYPNRRAFGQCQVDRCVSSCGATGSNCTPSTCTRSCPGYARGCR